MAEPVISHHDLPEISSDPMGSHQILDGSSKISLDLERSRRILKHSDDNRVHPKPTTTRWQPELTNSLLLQVGCGLKNHPPNLVWVGCELGKNLTRPTHGQPYPQRKEVQTIPRPITGQSRGARQKLEIQGRVYSLTQHDANNSNAMVTGIIPVSTTYAYALFDPGATHSFISTNFAKKHNFKFEPMESKSCVDALVGGVVVIDSVYKSCIVKIADKSY